MVNRGFVAFIELLILVACAMAFPAQITTVWKRTVTWTKLLMQHPQSAIVSLWIALWSSWLAVGTVAGLLIAAAFVPQMIGYGTAKAFFVLANVLFFIKLSGEEKLHGDKGNRKHTATRAIIIIILLVGFVPLSLLERAWVTNLERGNPPTWPNIWNASLFGGKPPEAVQPTKEAGVRLAIGIGDDTASNVLVTHDLDKPGDLSSLFERCAKPFTCYTEEYLQGHNADFGSHDRKGFRLFFMVANVSKPVIPNPSVMIAINPSETPNYKSVSIYRIDQRHDSIQSSKVELSSNVPLLPFTSADTVYDYPVDIELSDPSVRQVGVIFRITSENLKSRTLATTIRW